MAHEIEQMAFVGQTPWHGLGNQLTEHQPLDVWAEQAGMNWRIEKSPVRFIAGAEEYLGSLQAFEERHVLYRSDTNAPLSVVSDRYNVVQPEEILEFYRDLTEVSGFELETAGVLKGGKKLWALARTGQSGTVKRNDVSNGYVLLATACDGTMATTAQFTSIRVVCNNTLAIALSGTSSNVVKVPHSTRFDAEAVKQQLGISISVWDDFMYQLNTLSDRKVTPKEARAYVEGVFNPPPLTSNTRLTQTPLNNAPSLEETPPPIPNERAMNNVIQLFEGQGQGSTLASSQGTAFGLLNSVTEFVDHHRRARNTDYRLDSAWFGQGATLKQRALQDAIKLIA